MWVQVAVCTPGRMIDLIKMKACTCKRVTYLVFDEADRMFDMGFEPQASSAITMRPESASFYTQNTAYSAYPTNLHVRLINRRQVLDWPLHGAGKIHYRPSAS